MAKGNDQRALIYGGVVVALLAIGVLITQRGAPTRDADTGATPHGQASANAASPPKENAKSPGVLEQAAHVARKVTIRARLIGGAGARGTVSAGQLGLEDWNQSVVEKKHSAIELARFDDATTATITADAAGNGLLEVHLLPAPVYRIDALRTDDFAWYRHDLIPNEGKAAVGDDFDVGDIEPRKATGLRLTFKNAGAESHVELTPERIPDPQTTESASEWLSLTGRVRPELLAALRGEAPLLVRTDQPLLLAPLPPDPRIRLSFRTLTVGNQLSSEAPLAEGKITDVEIDLAKLSESGARGFATLTGTLVFENGVGPAAGLTIRRTNAPVADEQTTTKAGGFRFDALPAGVECTFTVDIPRPFSGHPIAPPVFTFSEILEAGENDRSRSIPTYKWLALTLSEAEQEELDELAKKSPLRQTIYLLQSRTSASSEWTDGSATEFLIEPGRVEVSIEKDAEYRIVAAPTSIFEIASEPAEFKPGLAEASTKLAGAIPDARSRTLTIAGPDGEILKIGKIWLNGGHRSLPPIQLLIPSSGVIALPPLNVEMMNVTVMNPSIGRAAVRVNPGGGDEIEIQVSESASE
ncbi:hypothetical protein BH09SUM1_BH09SUM1_07090 [soil metagenome]